MFIFSVIILDILIGFGACELLRLNLNILSNVGINKEVGTNFVLIQIFTVCLKMYKIRKFSYIYFYLI